MSTNGFDVVLCPVDFSDISADALRQAASLTACTNGRLVVPYANWPTFGPASPIGGDRCARNRDALRSHCP